MTQPNPTESATDRLRTRVEEARSRAATRAERAAGSTSQAAQAAVGFVKDHPLATVGGAVLIGAIVAQMLPGKIGRGSRRSSRRVLDLAATAAELAIAYGKRAGETAAEAGRDGSIKLGHASHDLGATLTERINKLAGDLGDRLGDTSEVAQKRGADLADAAIDLARDAATLAARKLREIAAKLNS